MQRGRPGARGGGRGSAREGRYGGEIAGAITCGFERSRSSCRGRCDLEPWIQWERGFNEREEAEE